jgi:hypothetical protein
MKGNKYLSNEQTAAGNARPTFRLLGGMLRRHCYCGTGRRARNTMNTESKEMRFALRGGMVCHWAAFEAAGMSGRDGTRDAIHGRSEAQLVCSSLIADVDDAARSPSGPVARYRRAMRLATVGGGR